MNSDLTPGAIVKALYPGALYWRWGIVIGRRHIYNEYYYCIHWFRPKGIFNCHVHCYRRGQLTEIN
jgi:hypothetical protein